MSLAKELAIKHRLSHYVQGDDGFGGEDEANPKAVAAINEALERAAQECDDAEAKWATLTGLHAEAEAALELSQRIRALKDGAVGRKG